MRAISLFACRPSAHLLFSSLLCRAGRETRRCTVKIWQRGNEETLSTTDLDTIQIGFAKIPVIYHLFLSCFPFTPPIHASSAFCRVSLVISLPPHPFPSFFLPSDRFSSSPFSSETPINREHVSLSLLISSPTNKAR